MAPTKFRGWCLNGCGRQRKVQNTKYCSAVCREDHRYRTLLQLLEDGLYPPVSNYNRFIKRFLLDKFGERCARCGWDERNPVTGRVPVEVEHIDGNWKNNTVENRTLLCPNCHSLTSTFRGLNRGRGRPHRLGGRQNPLGVPRVQTAQVEQEGPEQVELFRADVAERLKARDL